MSYQKDWGKATRLKNSQRVARQTNHPLLNHPHLYALFIHCLRLGWVHGDPQTPWSDLLGAGLRSPGQIAAENSPAPTSGSSNDRPTCTPHCFRFGAGYPHFAIFIRAPALGRSGRASGGRSSFLLV